jgi:dicarboxylate transporter 10
MALAGSMAGLAAGVVGNPADLMMVRMQADKVKSPRGKSRVHSYTRALHRSTIWS